MKTGLWESKTTYFGLIALVFCVSFFLQLFTFANPDLAWLTFAAAKMLGGAVPYQDLLEPNPPLVLWLSAVPVWFATQLSLPLVLTLKIFTLGTIATILYVCGVILKQSSLWQEKERYSFLIAIAAALLISADSYMVFAQREHLLVVLLLPYVLLQLPSVSRRSLSVIFQGNIGLLAAVGLCLKPHFFAIVVCLGICRLWQSRALRPIFGVAEVALIVTTLGYAAAIWIFTPQYFAWMKIFAPLYGAHGFFKWGPAEIASNFVVLGLLGIIFAAPLGAFKVETHPLLNQDKTYLMVVAVGAYLEALLQFKAWDYIAYPFMAFGIIFMAAVILLRPVKHVAVFVLLAVFFYTPAPWDDQRQDYARARYQNLMPTLDAYRELNGVYCMSLGFMPVEFYRTTPPFAWVNKFNTYNYLLAGIMEKNRSTGQPTIHVRPERQAAERWLMDTVAADIIAKKPELIVTVRWWDKNENPEDAFDFIVWMKKDAQLTRILDNYTMDKRQKLFDESIQQNTEYSFFIRNDR